MVVRAADPRMVVDVAHKLLEVLKWALAEIGLTLSLLRRKNYLLHAMGKAPSLFKWGDPSTRRMQAKDYARYRWQCWIEGHLEPGAALPDGGSAKTVGSTAR